MRFSHLRSAGSLFASRRHRAASQRSNRAGNRRLHLFAESLESREVPATITWDGGAGSANFHDQANWSGDQLPGPADDVIIPALPGNSPVYVSGSYTLGSVRSDAPILLRPGTPTAGNDPNFGELIVTAGNSVLNKGVFVDYDHQDTLRITATGSGTRLTVEGPTQFVRISSGKLWAVGEPIIGMYQVLANYGAAITISNPDIQRIENLDIAAIRQDSSIVIRNQTTLSIDGRGELAAASYGIVKMPDLKKITLNPAAKKFSIMNYRIEFDKSTNRNLYHYTGEFWFDKLETIEDLRTDKSILTEFEIFGNTGRFEAPELTSLSYVDLTMFREKPSTAPFWNTPKLKSLTDSFLMYRANQGTTSISSLVDIDDTTIWVLNGNLELTVNAPIDLSRMQKQNHWLTNGAGSSLKVTFPEMRGAMPAGANLRIESGQGSKITIDATAILDDSPRTSNGGVRLSVNEDATLRVNVARTRGTVLDIFETGTAVYDQVIDARFEMLRGASFGSGMFYAARMASLTVDDFVIQPVDVRWMHYSSFNTAMYNATKLVAPNLEFLNSDFISRTGWTEPAFPAYRNVTWDGGAGTKSWMDSANWSDDRIPGPNTTVIIPDLPGSDEIVVDASVNIRKVESRERLRLDPVNPNAALTFRVTAGASVLHAGVTIRSANLVSQFSGTTLDIYGVSNPGTSGAASSVPSKLGFSALNGSWLFLHDTTRFEPGLFDFEIRSSGGGSRVIFPSLSTAEFATDRAGTGRSSVRLIAENRAEIDLQRIRSLTADYITMTIVDSWISSPTLKGVDRANVSIEDTTDDGVRHSDWIAPGLEFVTSSKLRIHGGDITASFDNVQSIDATELRAEGAKVYFPAVGMIDISKFEQISTDAGLLSHLGRTGTDPSIRMEASGESGLLEIRASELSGNLPKSKRFEISANDAFVALHIPKITIPQSGAREDAQLVLSAKGRGVLRAYATTLDGLTIEPTNGGAVAIDQAVTARLRQVGSLTSAIPGKLYASNLEELNLIELNWPTRSNLDMVVAPNSKRIAGSIEAIANPFPLVESITGNILIKHQPGTPVSQITVFDTPKIGTIRNLTVIMDVGVSWPQLEAQADWAGNQVSVFRRNADGSLTPITRGSSDGGGQPVVMSASLSSVEAPQPAAAKAKTTPVAVPKAAANAKTVARPIAVPAKPRAVAKPKPVAAKPKKVAVKPAPAPKKAVAVAKPAAKAVAKR